MIKMNSFQLFLREATVDSHESIYVLYMCGSPGQMKRFANRGSVQDRLPARSSDSDVRSCVNLPQTPIRRP